jgi:ABC-type phosphate transport system substrate-binding protein
VALPLIQAMPARTLVVIVNPSTGVQHLSRREVADIFLGKISPPFAVPDAQTAIDIVAHNPNAIAYVGHAAVDQRVRIALEITP